MSALSNHSDNDLFLLIKGESVDAFVEVYDRYWHKLFNAAHKRVKNASLCEEIVQDVFLKCWEKRTLISLTVGLSNYLYTGVKYAVIDHYRKELLKENFLKLSSGNPGVDNSNEENIMLSDLKHLVEITLESLPRKCRTVYQLSRIESKTNKEIASILNISEKTVEGHLTNALKSLRFTIDDISIILLVLLLK